jgi:predicted outer membrane protein
MSSQWKFLSLTCACMLAVACSTSVAFAQAQNKEKEGAGQASQQAGQQPGGQTPRDRSPDRPGQVARPGQADTGQYRQGEGQQADEHIATCLLIGNQAEVALGRFALQHAKNEKVKQFAQKMIDVHSQTASQLQRFAGREAGLNIGDSRPGDLGTSERDRTSDRNRDSLKDAPPGAEAARQPGRQPGAADQVRQPGQPGQSNQPNQPGVRPGDRSAYSASDAHHGDKEKWMAVGKEIAQKCLELTKTELGKHSEDFDQAYLGQQVCGHIHMLSMLEVYGQHASPELRQLIQKSLTVTQEHLRNANELIKEVEGQSTTAASRTGATKAR